MSFQLSERLQQDCFTLKETDHSIWLLLNNCNFPWFIIVPKTEKEELYQLSIDEQNQLQKETNQLSTFINQHFPCDKLNIASIGNIVRQMHIHIIARSELDPCWPGVVWGTKHTKEYENHDVQIIKKALDLFLAQAE